MQDQQGRLKTITFFTELCTTLLNSIKSTVEQAQLDILHRHFELEKEEFHQALPLYAAKPDFLNFWKQNQSILLRSAPGSGMLHEQAC